MLTTLKAIGHIRESCEHTKQEDYNTFMSIWFDRRIYQWQKVKHFYTSPSLLARLHFLSIFQESLGQLEVLIFPEAYFTIAVGYSFTELQNLTLFTVTQKCHAP